MIKKTCVVSLFLALFVVSGCASYTAETREMRSLYRSGAYSAALKDLEETDVKEQSNNRLLYKLEKAMILDRLDQGKKARKLLIEADKIADELYTVSISKTLKSFVVSESSSDYGGEDFEQVAIHTQMALSFLDDNDFSAAAVEARKINNKLSVINSRYEDSKNKYSEDAFARYLTGVIWESKGDWDAAIISYSKALKAYEGSFAKFNKGNVPDELIKALYRLVMKRRRTDKSTLLETKYPKLTSEAKSSLKKNRKMGQVIVVHEVGHIVTKTTNEFFIGSGNQVTRFSFPVYRKRRHYHGQTGIFVLPGGRLVSGETVADLDEIARTTLEDRRFRLMAKQAARLIVKGQLNKKAEEAFGPFGGLLANIFTAATETADTRSWTLLPESYYITRLFLKPGKRDIKIMTNGQVSSINSIKVKKGKTTLLRAFGL